MGNGQKPALSVSIKPVGGEKDSRTYILAGWEHNGKVSSLLLDKRVKAMKLLMDDDTTIVIGRGTDGKPTHYFDVYQNKAKDPDAQVPPGDDEW